MLVEVPVGVTSGAGFVIRVGQARAAADAGDVAMLTRRRHPVVYVDRAAGGYRIASAMLPVIDPPRWVAAAARILDRTT